jgi:GAF domain-containing protein/anti-sigma regulatory factor (Ser/Thr protein kinase)
VSVLDASQRKNVQSRREVLAMLPVSHAVLAGGPLSAILDRIAAQAADVVEGADRASILLVAGVDHSFRLGGSHGLSPTYRTHLSTGTAKLRPGEGPSGVAYVRRCPVIVSDVTTDPVVTNWTYRDYTREEDYGAIASLPLIIDDQFVGTLNLYRREAGPWSAEQVQVLTFFADHAACAVRTAQLLDQRNKQVLALRRLTRALREQTHEHANRLHAISGLLALDEVDEARELVEGLEEANAEVRSALDARIQVPVVAGLVLADTVAAAQRGISLRIDDNSSLRALPPMLSDTQVVTILGNLLDNAFDAVAEARAERRTVQLLIDDSGGRTIIEVTDRGPGIDGDLTTIFDRGRTTKDGHEGVGLALVQEAVNAAMGAIAVDSDNEGTTVRVSFSDG